MDSVMQRRSPEPKAVLILAGGRSSRMGQDKAQLPVHGIPLLRRVYEVAAAVSSTVAVVTPWPKRYQPLLPKSCRFIQEPLPAEGDKPPGPLVGLLRGLEWLQDESSEIFSTTGDAASSPWILLLACDLPRLNLETLQAGTTQLTAIPPDVLAFVPQSSEGWEPLCAFYRQDCLIALTTFVQRGGRSFQGWLGEVTVQPWNLGDRQVLFNCNTVEDWQKAEEQLED
ncbi:molybdenum cofactor guanylyltransferase [Leptolyngbya sp. PL-A3]|uniref:molybdenum cofactor guanylyltransferase n=1 Tax=Leptolyngbya sp. PL-A3 TaxID=2933911 RepID=UPI00329A7BF7